MENSAKKENNTIDTQKPGFTNFQKILIITVATGAGITVVAASPILLGFGKAGIVFASKAAAIQSGIGIGIGNGIIGSLFAATQSLGAKGTFVFLTKVGASAAGVGAIGLTATSEKTKSGINKIKQLWNRNSKLQYKNKPEYQMIIQLCCFNVSISKHLSYIFI